MRVVYRKKIVLSKAMTSIWYSFTDISNKKLYKLSYIEHAKEIVIDKDVWLLLFLF